MTVFQEALSDFMYDMASGGAIRQMAVRGYTVEQIMKSLDFPTPRERVERTVYQYLVETGILLEQLPEDVSEFGRTGCTIGAGRRHLAECVYEHMTKNGEEKSYLYCPFGEWKKNDHLQLEERLMPLNQREKEYIMGIPFAKDEMYHRLTGRMYEIAVKLVAAGTLEGKFYFFQEKKILVCSGKSAELSDNKRNISKNK